MGRRALRGGCCSGARPRRSSTPSRKRRRRRSSSNTRSLRPRLPPTRPRHGGSRTAAAATFRSSSWAQQSGKSYGTDEIEAATAMTRMSPRREGLRPAVLRPSRTSSLHRRATGDGSRGSPRSHSSARCRRACSQRRSSLQPAAPLLDRRRPPPPPHPPPPLLRTAAAAATPSRSPCISSAT